MRTSTPSQFNNRRLQVSATQNRNPIACIRRNRSCWPKSSSRLFGLAALTLVLAWHVGAYGQRTATATATVFLGVVVGVTVTDGGSGYTAAPAVSLVGGGGLGAAAVALVSGGAVSEIIVVAAGIGFTSAPEVVIAPPPPPPPVTANFTASPTSGQTPLAVQFTDQSSGPVVSWSWGFGDGATSTMQNPSYTYTSAGTFTATLTVTGSSGQTSSTSTTITVTNAPPPPPPQTAPTLSITMTTLASGNPAAVGQIQVPELIVHGQATAVYEL
jgi:PKD repeat protein